MSFLQKLFLILALLCISATTNAAITIEPNANSAMLDFAIKQWNPAIKADVHVKHDPSLPKQGFSIELNKTGTWIIQGADDHGLMYGLLDLSESLRLGLEPTKQASPKIHRRGLKFNIPLDARSPSYDDSGTSAVRNIPHMWERSFWHEFLDQMAMHRYNVLTLWCNHPFTTMVELEEYPDVAIPDVAVPTYTMDEHMLIQYRKEKLSDPRHYKIVKRMTLKEKIAHWRHVMRYAKERGIDIYFITWNIWLHGAEGKYGIDYDQTNLATIEYVRKSMEQMVLTYPDLKGFGVTAGENMQKELQGEHSVENWLWNTYGQGVADALTKQPGHKFDFIHRVWYTGIEPMKSPFLDKYPGRIDVSFKYAKARLYSMPNPPFFNSQLRDEVERFKVRCWMNLRNDDIYNFRWGDPDYVRDFLKNLPPEPTLAGFHMGSDGYVWGREFTSKQPDSPRQLEIDKHWYRFMLWGRLSYDPSLGRPYFEAKLAKRFPTTDAAQLYKTWQVASKIVPKINLAHWRDWDHMWSVETCMSKKEGYHSVDHFIEFGPHWSTDMLSIPKYIKNPKAKGKSPFTVAEQLDELAISTHAGVLDLSVHNEQPSKELQETLSDLKAFAYLAEYYADKLRGATEVHRFRVTGDAAAKQAAIEHLQNAVKHWLQYGEVASKFYDTQLLARVNTTEWLGTLLEHAKQDIQLARQAEQGVFPPSTLLSNMPKQSE